MVLLAACSHHRVEEYPVGTEATIDREQFDQPIVLIRPHADRDILQLALMRTHPEWAIETYYRYRDHPTAAGKTLHDFLAFPITLMTAPFGYNSDESRRERFVGIDTSDPKENMRHYEDLKARGEHVSLHKRNKHRTGRYEISHWPLAGHILRIRSPHHTAHFKSDKNGMIRIDLPVLAGQMGLSPGVLRKRLSKAIEIDPLNVEEIDVMGAALVDEGL